MKLFLHCISILKLKFNRRKENKNNSSPVLKLLLCLVFISAGGSLSAQSLVKEAAPGIAGNRTQWFTDARFGMFIHWGAYAVPAKGEWAMHKNRIPYHEYEQIAKSFQPNDFNAEKVVRMAKEAGMKYLVITAKHHDGFCMWNTALTDYNIVKWGNFKRDPLKELAKECKKQGMKLGFYYSVRDWHHPDYVLHYEHLEAPGPNYKGWYAFPVNWTGGKVMDCGCSACIHNLPITKEQDPRKSEAEGANMDRYLDYMKGQIRELLTNYGPIAVMWFDGQDIVDPKKGRVQEMIDEMRKLQPNVLINDRIAWEPGMGDYGISEGKIPGSGQIRPWETCMTLTNGGDWGYTPTTNFKSTKEIIRNLADIVSKGGNFLLNIAPDGKGIVSDQYQSGLTSIGDWMKVNGQSIYGCHASDLPQPKWGRVTTNGKMLYLHVFDWPVNGKLNIGNLHLKVKRAYCLANQQTVGTKLLAQGVELSLPKNQPDAVNSVIVLNME